jgi:hypothetical protein
VGDIERATDHSHGFVIHHSQGILHARKVILATGGRSILKSGSDGFGYSLARRLGHHVTATAPALVPLVLEGTMFHKILSGLSHDVKLTTIVRGRQVDSRIKFTGPTSISGRWLWTRAASGARHRSKKKPWQCMGVFFLIRRRNRRGTVRDQAPTFLDAPCEDAHTNSSRTVR